MGIPTAPKEWSYGLSCGCWPSGFTPDTLYAYISGIKMGTHWGIGHGPPANGLQVLTQAVHPCWWQQKTIRGTDHYETKRPGTHLFIPAVMGNCFSGISPLNCVFYFVNGNQNPDDPFYGGHAVIFQKEPRTGNAPSLSEISELLNMLGQESRKSEAFPLDNEELVAMFADQVESTRIRIKYKFS